MYTNNDKSDETIQISREKSPFSDEREEIIFAERRGNLLEESNPRSTPAHRFDSNRVPRLRTSVEPKDRALRARHAFTSVYSRHDPVARHRMIVVAER